MLYSRRDVVVVVQLMIEQIGMSEDERRNVDLGIVRCGVAVFPVNIK